MENIWDIYSRGEILKPNYNKKLVSKIKPPAKIDLNKVIKTEPIAVNWGAGLNPFSDYNEWRYEYQIMVPVILAVIFLTPLILLIVELCK